MTGKNVFKCSLKLSEKVKTLPTKTPIKLSDLLFQRLVVLANGCNISDDDFKGHEL